MANLFKLVAFLLRSAGAYGYSRVSVAVLLAAGFVAGLASTGLLAVINAKLNDEPIPALPTAWAFVALCALLPTARFLSQYLLVRLTQGLSFDLRMALSRRILAAPLRQLEELGPSRLLATLTDDVGTLSGALTNLPLLSLHLTVIASCLVYLGFLSISLLLVVLGAVAVGVLTYRVSVNRAMVHFARGREAWDRMFASFRGLTEGTKELKLHRRRRKEFLHGHLETSAAELRDHNVLGTSVHALANSWGQVLFFLVIGLILFVAPGVRPLSDETTTGYTLAILYMLTPLDVVMNLLPTFGRAMVALGKIDDLGLSVLDPIEEDRPPRAGSWSQIRLADVKHTFYREDDDDAFTLGPISLALKPGELIFVVGGNGSGKTTLAKILLGLYAPAEGSVVLDGRAVGPRDLDDYRQLFTAVFADFFLFEALFGIHRQRLDESALRYLSKLHLERKVTVEGDRLSTLDLSQGQRKRLALLTAYLEDRSIYLFDEWAADQDPHFKEIFYRQLLPELRARGKTIVAITHDDRYYEVAERIVKLEEGLITYDGAVEGYLELALAAQISRPATAR